jgi:parallel beta-helix repeat protein
MNRFTTGLSGVALVLAAGCAAAHRSPATIPGGDVGVVHVAPPTGTSATDRASILAALEQVEPGGTIQFAPGTYLVGEIVLVRKPGITLQAHSSGTTLRGCEPGQAGESVLSCGMMVLLGGGVTLRGFTIEQSQLGVCISTCLGDPQAPVGDTVGGYRIEDNTFRNSLNGVRGQVVSSDTSFIRDNLFINTFHAVSFLEASNLHVVDNRISAPEPEQMPGLGHVSFAIAVGGSSNLIARNRIEGHPDGILLAADPGGTSSGNVIRENTIAVARNRLPSGGSPALASSDPADSTIVGVPLALHGLRTARDTTQAGRVSDNLVEDNRILGAEGIGIELSRASGNRIVGNQVSGVVPRQPFPGNSVSTDPAPWRDANGSAIWVSPESDDNEIAGNVFEDIAGAAVVLEGDSNRVALEGASGVVRDLGSGNRVTAPSAVPAAPEQARTVWRPVASPDRAQVSALASSGGTLFAGTMAGLFASEDLGTSWQLRGPASHSVGRLLPTAEGALLAGTYRQGILRSNDGGRTWSTVGFERNIYIVGLVQESDGPIYAAVLGAVEDEPTGVFRSSDDGRTWVATGLETEEVYSLSLPRPGLLFAGTRRGLFRSEDGGATWSRMGALPSEAPVSRVVAAGGNLYAAMGARLYRIPGGGVARSADGGRTWEPTGGLPPGIAVLDLAVREGSVFAAAGDVVRGGGKGLFRLDEAGTWRPAGLEDAWLRQLLDTPDGLFAGAYELGVFHSPDGRTWSHRSAGLRNWAPTSLLFDAEGLLYALSVRSLFRSADRGRSWVETPRPAGSAAPTPWSLTIGSRGDLVLAGNGGVLVSSDAGESWDTRPIPGEEGQVFAVTSDARGRLFAVVPGRAAYESSDVGRSWIPMELPATPRQALFSTPDGARLVATADGTWRWTEGESWQAVAEELVWDVVPCGEALIAGTYARGLLRSTDDGRTWAPVTEELRAGAQQAGYMTFTSLACLPGGRLLAGTFWDGVFYSADGGDTWVDVSAGLPSPTSQGFATTPDGQVFVATPAGVYRADFTGGPERGDGSVPMRIEVLDAGVSDSSVWVADYAPRSPPRHDAPRLQPARVRSLRGPGVCRDGRGRHAGGRKPVRHAAAYRRPRPAPPSRGASRFFRSRT